MDANINLKDPLEKYEMKDSTCKNPIEGIKKEYEKIESQASWTTLFYKLREITKFYEYTYTKNDALLEGNFGKNRYRDVLPYDHTRIRIKRNDKEKNDDYINASLVNVPQANRSYILTQGPLKNTKEDFWLMVWQENCPAVVMLNKTIENNMEKCAKYWPSEDDPVDEGNEKICKFKRIQVKLIATRHMKAYVISELEMSLIDALEVEAHEDSSRKPNATSVGRKLTRKIKHYQYRNWPDFGVPDCPDTFLEFLNEVQKEGVLQDVNKPVAVHCSAGIGRSGTFVMVDSSLVLISKSIELNVINLLIALRKQRFGLVQSVEQLRFTYQAIISGVEKKLLPTCVTVTDTAAGNSNNNNNTDSSNAKKPIRNISPNLIPPVAAINRTSTSPSPDPIDTATEVIEQAPDGSSHVSSMPGISLEKWSVRPPLSRQLGSEDRVSSTMAELLFAPIASHNDMSHDGIALDYKPIYSNSNVLNNSKTLSSEYVHDSFYSYENGATRDSASDEDGNNNYSKPLANGSALVDGLLNGSVKSPKRYLPKKVATSGKLLRKTKSNDISSSDSSRVSQPNDTTAPVDADADGGEEKQVEEKQNSHLDSKSGDDESRSNLRKRAPDRQERMRAKVEEMRRKLDEFDESQNATEGRGVKEIITPILYFGIFMVALGMFAFYRMSYTRHSNNR